MGSSLISPKHCCSIRAVQGLHLVAQIMQCSQCSRRHLVFQASVAVGLSGVSFTIRSWLFSYRFDCVPFLLSPGFESNLTRLHHSMSSLLLSSIMSLSLISNPDSVAVSNSILFVLNPCCHPLPMWYWRWNTRLHICWAKCLTTETSQPTGVVLAILVTSMS